MTTKHYIVLVNEDVDLDQFWSEMETGVSPSPYIPKRPVVVLSNWDAYPRMCDYELTPDEADNLRKDLRVEYVDVPHNQNPDVEVVYGSQQTGNFIRSNSSDQKPSGWPTWLNWGLVRHSNVDHLNNSSWQYSYSLDGTGVDVVITDSGIQVDHPDFNNLNGVSRIQQINWGAIHAPLANFNPYVDNDGHGTNVAGIAASTTYGWAKNSNVYALSGTGNVDSRELFECIRKWHLLKPVDPSTGNKRPTVVNMSWGLTTVNHPSSAVQRVIDSITSVNYRGETFNGPFTIDSLIAKGIHKDSGSMSNYLQREDAGADYALDVLINSGVIVCRCAMNNSYKIDVPGGQDYNNSFTTNTGSTLNYHRGFSPKSQ